MVKKDTLITKSRKLPRLPPKSNNYWVLENNSKESFLRFAHINPNRIFDVYPNTYESIPIFEDTKGKQLKIMTRDPISKTLEPWKIIVIPAFFGMIKPELPHGNDIKKYKRLNILQYIYFLYTIPDQLVNFNTEMLLKQYLRTSDFISRSIVTCSLFDLLRTHVPEVRIFLNIFQTDNYEKVLNARLINVDPLIRKANVDKSESQKDIGPESLMAAEQSKGNLKVMGFVEATIRIYQKDLYQFIKKTLELAIQHIFSYQLPLSEFCSLNFLPGLPLSENAVANNIYSVMYEFNQLYMADYYHFEESEQRNIVNLMNEIAIWNTFLRIFQVMEQHSNIKKKLSGIQIKDFFMPISKMYSISLKDIKGTPYNYPLIEL